MKRLFVGIPLSFALKQKLKPLIEQLSLPGVNPVALENLHLTVKFLGEVEEGKLEEIQEILEELSLRTPSFRVELTHLGEFPDEEHPKVLWVGLEDGELVHLMRLADRKLDYIRENEHKEEIPHLTLARIKSEVSLKQLKPFFIKYGKTNFGVWDIDQINLYEAKLTPKGPTYRPVREFKLKMS